MSLLSRHFLIAKYKLNNIELIKLIATSSALRKEAKKSRPFFAKVANRFSLLSRFFVLASFCALDFSYTQCEQQQIKCSYECKSSPFLCQMMNEILPRLSHFNILRNISTNDSKKSLALPVLFFNYHLGDVHAVIRNRVAQSSIAFRYPKIT